MLRLLPVLATLVSLAFLVPVAAQDNNRARVFDEQIRPLLEQFKAYPSRENLQIIGRAVETFNTRRQTPAAQEERVVALNPLWLPTQLRERGATKAALSLCGAELHSCDEARRYLQHMTAQCSSVFLGIIDVDTYPGTPRNLYDTDDPRLILLLPPPETKALVRVGIHATINPDTVAIVMCPEESKAFGPALRALRIPF
jgi:hypothetical protein